MDSVGSKVSIGRAAKELGAHHETQRRWEKQGKIVVERTPTGFRRYDLAQRHALGRHKAPSARITLPYARVSSHDPKDDLARQVALLESFAAANGWSYEVLQDLGSGLNDHKKGLRQLLRRIGSGEVGRLVLTHKDRLRRFGSELVFALCEHFGTEVIIVNASEDASFEEELVQDVLEIITVFSARLYGSRSHKNKEVLDALKKAANEVGAS